MAKDDLTFKVVRTNSAKQTVTLRPTFGTLLKLNATVVALFYCGKLLVECVLDDREEKKLQAENDPSES